MFRRIAVLASAAAGVVAVAVLFVLFGSSAKLTFAQVAEQITKTRSISVKMTTTAPGKPAEIVRIAILADGLSRMDTHYGYTVMDAKTGKAMCVSTREKAAKIMLGIYVPSGVNLYELVRNSVDEKSKRLPDEVIDGRNVNVFRAEPNEQLRKEARGPCEPMKVWVDPKTRLPIRMEPMQQNGNESVVMEDFVFDKPLDASLFSFDPPKGYEITTVGSPATWQEKPLAEKDLLAPEVIPGVGLGAVKFGMSKEEVISFGKPDMEEKGSMQYPSRGFACMIGPPQRGLVGFIFFSQQECAFKVRDFAGKTKEGIGIGSSLKDIEKAFGKPTSVEHTKEPGATGAYVRYGKLGLDFTLFYDKVVGFMMQQVRQSSP